MLLAKFLRKLFEIKICFFFFAILARKTFINVAQLLFTIRRVGYSLLNRIQPEKYIFSYHNTIWFSHSPKVDLLVIATSYQYSSGFVSQRNTVHACAMGDEFLYNTKFKISKLGNLRIKGYKSAPLNRTKRNMLCLPFTYVVSRHALEHQTMMPF